MTSLMITKMEESNCVFCDEMEKYKRKTIILMIKRNVNMLMEKVMKFWI